MLAALPRTFEAGKAWQSPHGSCIAPRPLGGSGKVAFVYSGMSGVTVGMGRDLFRLVSSAHELLEGFSDPREALNTPLLFPSSLAPIGPKELEDSHARLFASPLDLLKLVSSCRHCRPG